MEDESQGRSSGLPNSQVGSKDAGSGFDLLLFVLVCVGGGEAAYFLYVILVA